jgi:hypothetical protein
MLSIVVLLAMIALPVVRAPHVHPACFEGRARAIVHSHQLQMPGRGASERAAHGDHSYAIFPTSMFETVSRNTPPVPLQDHALPVLPPSYHPQFSVLGPVHAERLSRPAGPPGALVPGRSPPRDS